MFPYVLDHVAVAVHSLEESCPIFALLAGAPCSPPETLEDQGVRVSFSGSLELLEPLGPETTVARFLDRGGPGIHHIAYRVSDLSETLERLQRDGFRLIDPKPRTGARGHQVAFLHPKSTGGILVELVAY